jgi:hypothetical protein
MRLSFEDSLLRCCNNDESRRLKIGVQGRWPKAVADSVEEGTIVLGGLMRGGGVASFTAALTPADADMIRAFIVDWAQRPAPTTSERHASTH